MSCSESTFELDAGCRAECSAQDGPANCYADVNSCSLSEVWDITSLLFLFLSGGDIIGVNAGYSATGRRISPDLMQLSGQIDVSAVDSSTSLIGGVLELAVFRYSGAPGDFDGVLVERVDQLVALGLIDADDILFVETFAYTSSDFVLPFEFGVNVSGVPSDEIVLFASEAGVTLVPAHSGLGLLLLTVLMLAAATFVLRKRLRS